MRFGADEEAGSVGEDSGGEGEEQPGSDAGAGLEEPAPLVPPPISPVALRTRSRVVREEAGFDCSTKVVDGKGFGRIHIGKLGFDMCAHCTCIC